ncbi:hypothetical protein ABF179_002353 [Flavobacterium psychrophilum]
MACSSCYATVFKLNVMHITEILLADGYKTYKFIEKSNWNKDAKKQAQRILDQNKDIVVFKTGDINSDESSFHVPCGFNSIYLTANYNCMQNGGIAIFFVKDNDFENPFIFGLNEFGKQPTLIRPRPKIKYRFFNKEFERESNYDERMDDAMNFCLKSENHQDILNAIRNSFDYDTISETVA